MNTPRITLVGYDAEWAHALAAALTCIVDPDPAACRRAQAEQPGVHVTASLDAALEPGAVDVIVLQAGAHPDLIAAAANLGIATLALPANDGVGVLTRLLGVPVRTRHAGVSPDAFLHPTVEIAGAVEVGAGTRIWHFSKLLGPLKIGEKCSLGQNVVVERNVAIGDNVKIQNNVSVYSGVILEDDVFCGPSMVFTNVGTPRSAFPRRGQYATTRLEKGASVGANATIVCGHTLGRYAFVGAGAVVTKDVPAHALVYGNPARLRGWACYCGARLKMGITIDGAERCQCDACGRSYRRDGHRVEEESA